MGSQVIGADLKAFRERRGMNLAQLATATGLTQTALRKIERGAAPTEQQRSQLLLVGVREDEEPRRDLD